MSRVRGPFGRIFIAKLLIGSTCMVSGCGTGGDGEMVVQTPEESAHSQEINKNYSQNYAAKYSRKGAAKKR